MGRVIGVLFKEKDLRYQLELPKVFLEASFEEQANDDSLSLLTNSSLNPLLVYLCLPFHFSNDQSEAVDFLQAQTKVAIQLSLVFDSILPNFKLVILTFMIEEACDFQ